MIFFSLFLNKQKLLEYFCFFLQQAPFEKKKKKKNKDWRCLVNKEKERRRATTMTRTIKYEMTH